MRSAQAPSAARLALPRALVRGRPRAGSCTSRAARWARSRARLPKSSVSGAAPRGARAVWPLGPPAP
eukprot:1201609-Lingulodinium_polyedra.AAC.1